MKRAFDFFLALIGLSISMPLWIIFGLAIWLEGGAPVFYAQERVGKDGRIFKGWKFRSMIKTAEAGGLPVQAKENDARITSIGRILRASAMDELPQLWNIFKGDMSFVGPRALRPAEVDSENETLQSVWEFKDFKERSTIRPGLTGVAQILAPRDIPRAKKFKYDIWYIKNQNFWLDIYIVIISFLISVMARWETRKDRFKNLARNFRIAADKEIARTTCL